MAKSLMNEICICEPGTSMPECQAKLFCFSMQRTLSATSVLPPFRAGSKASFRAMQMASEAGPKPTQTIS